MSYPVMEIVALTGSGEPEPKEEARKAMFDDRQDL